MQSMTKQHPRLLACAALAAIHASNHVLPAVNAWAPLHYFSKPAPLPIRSHNPHSTKIMYAAKNEDGSGAVDEDWRDFRAQLVRSEKDDTATPSKNKPPEKQKKDDEEHWAYETGDFVERGSIVISVPSSNDFLNDVDALNNICYRKSIVLVLDVGPNFLQGIVLNRPTNIGVKEGMQFVQPGHGEVYANEMGHCLGDNCELEEASSDAQAHSARWKVWFGGEVGGPYSDYPQVMCLHSVSTDMARSVSDAVLPGIYVTSFVGAQKIVQQNEATPSDFWLFCGITGWETASFYSEMHELNMIRCEEEEELAMASNCDVDHDPRNAGLHMWEMLLESIGLDKEAHESEDSFGDLMLHEWATGALSFSIKDEMGTSMIMEPFSDPRFEIEDENEDSEFDMEGYDPASAMGAVESGPSDQKQSYGIVGVMVRASSAKRSPYLLSDQGFHKSLILVLRDGDNYSEGILLNHVTSRSLTLDLNDDKRIDMPIRYGGPAYYYDTEDNDDDEFDAPTVFLHSVESLRDAGIGTPIGKSKLFKCTKDEVIKVLQNNLASVDDFMAVQGFSVWTKKGEHTGVLGDVESGFFELVPRPKVTKVWDTLLLQENLAETNLSDNVSKGRLAWNAASRDDDAPSEKKEEIHVFGTDIDVMTLADEAAMRWVKVNLL